MNNRKPAIFLDVDGCLISDYGNVDADYYQAFFEISERVKKGNIGDGPTVRLCTARNINSVEIMCAILGIVNSFVITENGIALYNPATREIKLHPAVTEKMKGRFERIRRKIIPSILKEWPNLYVYPGNTVYITLVRESGTTPDIETIYEKIRRKLSGLIGKRAIRIFRSRDTINIGPPRINKGSGIRFLADVDNIDLSQSLGIGDTSQDFPFFRRVGLIGCPANASNECREFVRSRKGHISHFSYAQGVANIINHFLEK